MISIIIVNYNGKKWLKKCLDSLRDQTYADYEILLVDNASTDGSIEFVESNFKDDRIKIVRSGKNLGFAGGNNLGIDHCHGEYLLLLNNDTWVEKDFLGRIHDFYRQHDFDVVAPHEKDYENSAVYSKYRTTLDLFGHPVYLKNEGKSLYLSGVCLFFSKKLYVETLGLDDNFFMYFEEIDWFWRLNLLEKKFSAVDGLFVHHAGAGTTGTGIKYSMFLWRNQNALQMLLKNYAWYNLFWVVPIYFAQNIVEILFFLLIFKPKIAYSYVEGWIFNIKNIKRILEKRKWVQENRLVSDFQIMANNYYGFGKLRHLIGYFIK